MSENCVFGPSGQFLDIFRTFFRHFSDILSTFPFSGLSNDLPVSIAIPPTPDRPWIPIFWKRGFRGPKTPISLRPHTGWKREFLVKKSPFPLCSLAEKRGFLDRKLPFPGRGEMGIFGPRNPLFQKMGIRGLSGVRGIASQAVFTYTIRTSRIALPHFIFEERFSVIITPPITPNNFWGIS